MTNSRIDSPESLTNWIMPWPAFEIDWSRTGLMIIDLQNYSSNPECGIAEMISNQYPDVADQFTLLWDDPTININWPIENPILQARDKRGITK